MTVVPPGPLPPIAKADLLALLEFLNRPNPPPCTHAFKETAAFLQDFGLSVQPMLGWLTENGAFCDCEVIYNTADRWGDWAGFASEDEVEKPQ